MQCHLLTFFFQIAHYSYIQEHLTPTTSISIFSCFFMIYKSCQTYSCHDLTPTLAYLLINVITMKYLLLKQIPYDGILLLSSKTPQPSSDLGSQISWPPNFSVFCCNLADGFLYATQLNPQSEVNDMAYVKVTMVTVIMNCYSWKLTIAANEVNILKLLLILENSGIRTWDFTSLANNFN